MLSTEEGFGQRKFSKDLRRSFVDQQAGRTPGPGSYRAPSDFGQYDTLNN
jgi:hypothetical protein